MERRRKKFNFRRGMIRALMLRRLDNYWCVAGGGAVALTVNGVNNVIRKHKVLVDSGANVNITTRDLVDELHLTVDGRMERRIKTADKDGGLVTDGVVNVGGVIGNMQVWVFD
jgi:hypothetical protein